MARRRSLDDRTVVPASGELAGRRPAKPSRAQRATAIIRYTAVTLLVLGISVLALYGADRLDHLLATDERFSLPPSETGEGDSPKLEVKGLVHTSLPRVREIFAGDVRRSVYLIPLRERQEALRALPWVQNASVQRIWPDRVSVRVVERKPVAFVQVPVGPAAHRLSLIDAEGVLLDPPAKAKFSLPVLVGLPRNNDAVSRKAAVARFVHFVRAVNGLAEQVSEIDVADPANLIITQRVGDRAVVLMMGHEKYQARLETFLSHYEEIRARRPNARVFDLRLDDRITAAEGSGDVK
jgi:cell division septal protein FtsQ